MGVKEALTSGTAYRGFQAAVREATSRELAQPPLEEHVLSVALAPYRVEARHEGRRHARTMVPGHVAALPAGSEALWRFPEPAAALHLRLEADALPTITQEGGRRKLEWTLDHGDPAVAELGWALLRELRDGMPSGRLFGEAVRDALVARLTHAPALRESGLGTAALARATDLMRARLADDLSLDDLARAAGYSTYHFARLFRAATGETPHACLVRFRVERALELLRGTDLSVARVATEVGFSDAGHLARHFRRRYGAPPGAVRS